MSLVKKEISIKELIEKKFYDILYEKNNVMMLYVNKIELIELLNKLSSNISLKINYLTEDELDYYEDKETGEFKEIIKKKIMKKKSLK